MKVSNENRIFQDKSAERYIQFKLIHRIQCFTLKNTDSASVTALGSSLGTKSPWFIFA